MGSEQSFAKFEKKCKKMEGKSYWDFGKHSKTTLKLVYDEYN